jgi:nitroreductase
MPGKMSLGQPLAVVVKKRYSCRSFDGSGLDHGTLAALETFMAGVTPPFRSRLRFGVIDGRKVRAENFFSAGSYGMIKGARFYLCVLARKTEPRLWEDTGFALEATVLHATDLGLGSCWIGGVFDRRNFGRSLGMDGDEILPAVITVGRPAEKRSLRDRLVRWSARGNMRKPPAQLFFCRDWRTPLSYAECPDWAPVLENVRLGPSASNKQPWRIVRADDGFHFFLSRDKAYSALMPRVDLQRIDLGIAMCHFELGAQELGLPGEWKVEEPVLTDTPANFEYIVTFK